MKNKIFSTRLLALSLIALTLIIAGCSPTRRGTSWADVTLINDGQTLLVAYNDYIIQIDPANGRLIPLRNSAGEVRTDESGAQRSWQVAGGETSSQFFTTPIWLNDDRLLVADYNNKLLEVNATLAEVEPGTEVELPGHVIADPVLADNVLIVPFSDHDIAAYDAETYDQMWSYETERGVWAQPIVMDGVVYFSGMDHHLYALELETGREIWKLELEGALASAPLYHEGHFYVGTFGRKIYDVSMDGEILAEYDTENWVWSTPVLFDDILYATDLSGRVYALDISNGLSEIWKVRASSRGIRPSPLVTQDYIIVGDRGGRVFWLERPTGTVLTELTKDAGGEILSDIVLVQREEPFEPLVVVSTVRDSQLLVAYTLDSVAQWTYDR